MIQFGYHVTAGTVLVIDAIQSPNFVAGSSGWIIRQDGSVEFANATIRGVFEADGANNSFVRVTTTGGTGFGTAVIYLRPPDLPGINTSEITAASVTALSNQPGGAGIVPSAYLETQLNASSWSFGSTAVDVRYPVALLRTASHDGTVNPSITFTTGGAAVAPNTFDVTVDGNLTVNGTYVGKWIVGSGFSSNSAAIGATETVVATLSSVTFKANRAYRLKVTGMVGASVAGNNPFLRFRKTNTAGTQIDAWRVFCNNVTAGYNAHFESFMWIGGTDVTASMVLTLVGSAGFNANMVGAANNPWSFNIFDAGNAVDFSSWATQLT